MRIIKRITAIATAVLIAGCSSTLSLNESAQAVKFTEEKPGADCRFLGQASGEQSNWFSGNNERGSLRGAANELRNNAAAMGGNVLYNVSSPSQSFWSAFVPVASKLNAEVYQCPD